MSSTYCLRCKKNVEMTDVVDKINKRNVPYLGGKCSECNGNIIKLIKKKPTELLEVDVKVDKVLKPKTVRKTKKEKKNELVKDVTLVDVY